MIVINEISVRDQVKADFEAACERAFTVDKKALVEFLVRDSNNSTANAAVVNVLGRKLAGASR